MKSFFNFLSFVKKNLHYLMIIVIAMGLSNVYLFGGFDIPKYVLVSIVVIFIIYPVMINTKFEEVIAHLKEPRPLFCSYILNFLISPLIALILGKLFLSDKPELFVALLLLSLLPTSSMTAAWTALTGARMATALYLIPGNLLFAAFIGLPFILPYLIGGAVAIDRLAILKNIFLVFIIPLVVGDMTRWLITKYKSKEIYHKKIKPELGGISALSVLVLLFLVMSLKRNVILFQNINLVFAIVIPVVIYYGTMYFASIIWAKLLVWKKFLPGEKAVVLIYATVARHINISLALVLSAFAVEQASFMVLLIIVGYIIQLPSLAFYAQHWGKRFVTK